MIALAQKIKKLLKFIKKNLKAILAISAIVTFGSNAILFGSSLIHAIGETPHYYCDVDPPAAIKNSHAYQQYCVLNNGSNFTLDEINGHYIMQDGSGPCLACAFANMFLRYFTRNNINFYDYLWQEDGQYPVERQIQASIGSTWRTFTNYNSSAKNLKDDGTEKYTNKGDAYLGGVKKFGQKYGHNITMADWGYLRDDSKIYTGQPIGQAYDNLSANEKWVYDLSVWNSWDPGSTWTVGFGTGANVTIEGVKATLVVIRRDEVSSNNWQYNSGDDLRKLLDEHPSGIMVYRVYDGDRHHAILVSSYNPDGTFNVVDSGKGLLGGFEGPASSDTFCITRIYNDNVLNNPNQNGIIWYAYIEEDKP